jgi:hypothetical protein
MQVVEQAVLIEHGRREAEVFAEQIPIEARDLFGEEWAIEWAEAFVQVGDGGRRGCLRGDGMG